MPIPVVDDAVDVDTVLVVNVCAEDVLARSGAGHMLDPDVVVIMDEYDGVLLELSGVFGINPPC